MSDRSQLKDLLDLKQQQAGIIQAFQSVTQADEAVKQGRSILIFTVVSIIFVSGRNSVALAHCVAAGRS